MERAVIFLGCSGTMRVATSRSILAVAIESSASKNLKIKKNEKKSVEREEKGRKRERTFVFFILFLLFVSFQGEAPHTPNLIII